MNIYIILAGVFILFTLIFIVMIILFSKPINIDNLLLYDENFIRNNFIFDVQNFRNIDNKILEYLIPIYSEKPLLVTMKTSENEMSINNGEEFLYENIQSFIFYNKYYNIGFNKKNYENIDQADYEVFLKEIESHFNSRVLQIPQSINDISQYYFIDEEGIIKTCPGFKFKFKQITKLKSYVPKELNFQYLFSVNNDDFELEKEVPANTDFELSIKSNKSYITISNIPIIKFYMVQNKSLITFDPEFVEKSTYTIEAGKNFSLTPDDFLSGAFNKGQGAINSYHDCITSKKPIVVRERTRITIKNPYQLALVTGDQYNNYFTNSDWLNTIEWFPGLSKINLNFIKKSIDIDTNEYSEINKLLSFEIFPYEEETNQDIRDYMNLSKTNFNLTKDKFDLGNRITDGSIDLSFKSCITMKESIFAKKYTYINISNPYKMSMQIINPNKTVLYDTPEFEQNYECPSNFSFYLTFFNSTKDIEVNIDEFDKINKLLTFSFK